MSQENALTHKDMIMSKSKDGTYECTDINYEMGFYTPSQEKGCYGLYVYPNKFLNNVIQATHFNMVNYLGELRKANDPYLNYYGKIRDSYDVIFKAILYDFQNHIENCFRMYLNLIYKALEDLTNTNDLEQLMQCSNIMGRIYSPIIQATDISAGNILALLNDISEKELYALIYTRLTNGVHESLITFHSYVQTIIGKYTAKTYIESDALEPTLYTIQSLMNSLAVCMDRECIISSEYLLTQIRTMHNYLSNEDLNS